MRARLARLLAGAALRAARRQPARTHTYKTSIILLTHDLRDYKLIITLLFTLFFIYFEIITAAFNVEGASGAAEAIKCY